jgi:Protein of unknown function (DUF3306)
VSDDVNTRLSRWSQRKLAARRGALAEDARPESEKPPATPVGQTAALPAKPSADAEPPAEAAVPELPPIDELTFQSDYTAFLAKNVPETLRRAALRKLWQSDPVLANLDGLNDYDEDYNVIDTLITTAQTSYRPGKGYFDELEEKIEKQLTETGEKIAQAESERTESQTESTAAESESETARTEHATGETPDTPRQLAAVAHDTQAAESPEDASEK